MKVSIIIPLYNVAPYIKRCLDSVAAQTYIGDMECILVDDCGTDNSLGIARKWIDNYTGRIKFFIFCHTSNQGLSAARNTGIQVATGEYVYFLDSDDAITPECINILVGLAYKYPHADFIQGNTKQGPPGLITYPFRVDAPEHTADNILKSKLILTYTMITACNKLIKKTFISANGLFFPIGIVHEDVYWLYFVEKHTKEVAFTNRGTYCYYANENSIMNNSSDENVNRRISGYTVSINAMTDDVLKNGTTSKYQRRYVVDAILNYQQYVSSLHSFRHWISYWTCMLSLAWKVRRKLSFYRLLLFNCMMPPLCFLTRHEWWLWRIRHYIISRI